MGMETLEDFFSDAASLANAHELANDVMRWFNENGVTVGEGIPVTALVLAAGIADGAVGEKEMLEAVEIMNSLVKIKALERFRQRMIGEMKARPKGTPTN